MAGELISPTIRCTFSSTLTVYPFSHLRVLTLGRFLYHMLCADLKSFISMYLPKISGSLF